MKRFKPPVLIPWVVWFLFAVLAGCIRLSGGAGYWHKGAAEDVPTVHEVGFDTQKLVPSNKAPGSIALKDES